MKNIFIVLIVTISVIVFAAAQAMGVTANIKDFLQAHPTVKVCVELKNSSGDEHVDMGTLKTLIEKAFAARKSHTFEVVQEPAQADMLFKGDVVEYVWTESDPVDQVWGIGAAAMDAVMVESYGRIQVQTTLVETKHQRELWGNKVMATVTQKAMSKEASYKLVYEKFIKTVIIEVFRKRVSDSL